MKATPRGALPAFILAHVNDPHGDDDPCVLWPFGTTHGYGAIRWQGEMRGAHNVLLELRDGPAPTPEMEACHGPCHEPLCIIHTRWGTRLENIHHQVRDGTSAHGARNGRSKLTSCQVGEIRRRRAAGESCISISLDYPVREQAISKIARGKLWIDG